MSPICGASRLGARAARVAGCIGVPLSVGGRYHLPKASGRHLRRPSSPFAAVLPSSLIHPALPGSRPRQDVSRGGPPSLLEGFKTSLQHALCCSCSVQ